MQHRSIVEPRVVEVAGHSLPCEINRPDSKGELPSIGRRNAVQSSDSAVRIHVHSWRCFDLRPSYMKGDEVNLQLSRFNQVVVERQRTSVQEINPEHTVSSRAKYHRPVAAWH